MSDLPTRLRAMADHTGLDAVAELLREAAAALERERASRQAAQIENESLKDRIARSGVEQRRAVREATQRLHTENEALRQSLRIALEAAHHHPVSPALDAEVAMVLGLPVEPQLITGPCGQCKSTKDPCPCGNVNTGKAALDQRFDTPDEALAARNEVQALMIVDLRQQVDELKAALGQEDEPVAGDEDPIGYFNQDKFGRWKECCPQSDGAQPLYAALARAGEKT